MYTEAINHDPAITFFQSGSQIAGRPSMGAWVSYGLGSENRDLPAFVAMSSHTGGQPLYDRLWGSGFLPGRFQGVKFRSTGNPILDINNPAGVDRDTRRKMLDFTNKMNAIKREETGDPQIDTRIAQYELAYRMQMSVPELTDVSDESKHTFRDVRGASSQAGQLCLQLPVGPSPGGTRRAVYSALSSRLGSSRQLAEIACAVIVR